MWKRELIRTEPFIYMVPRILWTTMIIAVMNIRYFIPKIWFTGRRGRSVFLQSRCRKKQISGCMRPTVSKKMENIIFCIVWQMERRELQKVKALLDRLRTEESLRKPMVSIPALWLKKIRSIISGARWGSMEQSWISKLVKSGKRHIRPIFWPRMKMDFTKVHRFAKSMENIIWYMQIYQEADLPAWAMRSVITRLDLMKKKESSLTIPAVTLPPGTTMDLFRKLAKTIMCFITGLRITVYTADASVQRRYRSMKMEPLMKWRWQRREQNHIFQKQEF